MSESDQTPLLGSAATPEQVLQAEQEIDIDPQVTNDDGNGDAVSDEPEPGPYDDEDAWPFRKLQAEIKERNEGREDDKRISGQGTRDELVARLTEDDNAAKSPGIADEDGDPADEDEEIEGPDNAEASANGGIEVDTVLSGTHADILQGLSDARKASQLAALSETEQV